ncbi:hypothetical protein [Bacillus sp. FJAT-45037]|uniref:hypothetical protein n=1 Tax=Bacillus sp. FJAT-45037 TaxID=2011007 RepID=UPI000C245A67|nr:hypothetical protein [Bacillus sp. FJAT-45037]
MTKVKSHYMVAGKVIVFTEGVELGSSQLEDTVRELAFGQYGGMFSEIVVISESNDSRVFKGK